MSEGPDFLKKKYPNLVGSPTLDRSSKHLSGPDRQKAPKRIEAFLERLANVAADTEKFDRFSRKITESFVVGLRDEKGKEDTKKVRALATGLYESEKQIARDRGQQDEVARLEGLRGKELMDHYTQAVYEKVDEQRISLKEWFSYLNSPDAPYPTWFKYYVARSLRKMGLIDKERKTYTTRSDTTLAPFPELNREALALVYDLLAAHLKKDAGAIRAATNHHEEWQKILASTDFATLYAHAQFEQGEHEQAETLSGQWKVYKNTPQDLTTFYESLKGRATGWCVAGYETARNYLAQGDFHVYYSNDKDGKPAIPRVAIATRGTGNDAEITQVRGILPQQELEPELVDIARGRFGTMRGGNTYERRASDMHLLTTIDRKMQQGEQLTKEELVFLYELDRPIQGFGYNRDPRIEELQGKRDTEADLPIVLDCKPEQIARKKADLKKPDIKAYVGTLFNNFFKELPANVGHVYESFPDKAVAFKEIMLGGKSADALRTEITTTEVDGRKMRISGYAEDILKKTKVEATPANAELVIVSVAQLGFQNGATTKEIHDKAKKLGLDLAPAEVGPHLRLQYKDQPQGEWLVVGMEAITDRDGGLGVFHVEHDGDGLWLVDIYGHPDSHWSSDDRFVFVRRK
ncbi:MAG: hypothetical protein WAZ27_04585 [Minisyncoccia bacterium]